MINYINHEICNINDSNIKLTNTLLIILNHLTTKKDIKCTKFTSSFSIGIVTWGPVVQTVRQSYLMHIYYISLLEYYVFSSFLVSLTGFLFHVVYCKRLNATLFCPLEYI